MKRKIFTGLLALTMVMATGVTAFAAEPSGTISKDGGSQTIDVKAQYTGSIAEPDIISVDITWDSMEFVYSAAGTKTWNPDTHTYTDDTREGWANSGNTVKVTNHSNVKVGVNCSFKSDDSGVTGTIKQGNDDTGYVSLKAGEEGKPNGADSATFALELNGELSSKKTTSEKIGTITVVIEKLDTAS